MKAREVRSFARGDVPGQFLERPNLNYLTFYTIQDWAVMLLSVFAMTFLPPVFYPLLVFIMGGRIHALGVILHDLVHARFKKTIRIRVLEFFTGYFIGSTIEAMAYHHLRHHRDTLLDNDPYFNINKKCSAAGRFWLTFKKGTFLIPFWIARSFVGVFAFFIPSIRTVYGRIFLQDVSGKDLSHSHEVLRCTREDIPLATFHVLLLMSAFHFPFLFFAYYIPIIVGGIFCIYRLLIEHEYEIVEDRSVYSIIDCTFDHHMSWWERIFFGPRNIGFHALHHIHPRAGLHALPKLRHWYKENCEYYRDRTKTGPEKAS